MKILFIITELNSANGICAQSVMREMLVRGHDVYCLTNLEKHGELDNSIRYCYVKPRLVYRLLNAKSKLLTIFGKILNKIKLLFSLPIWPLISPLYAKRIYCKAKKICINEKIDIIVPIYTQIDTLVAIKRIKKIMPQIKYVPYFLDSLSGGYGPKCFSKEWIIKRGIKWEDRLLPLADVIVMMESSRSHYKKYCSDKSYYNKINFLDLPLISKPECFENLNEKKDTIDLLYIGSIPSHIRNPQPFLDVFCKTKNKKYRLKIIGTSTCADMLFKYAKNDSRIIIKAPVTHIEAIKCMVNADILVNFGNNNSAMTPSKIFEYMSYGKPIISTKPISDEPSAVYLRNYPSAYILDYTNIRDINYEAQNLEKWIDSVLGKKIEFDVVEKTFVNNTPEKFCSIITDMV